MNYVENYWNKTEKVPTVGDVILNVMKEHNDVDQNELKTIAVAVLSQFSNSLAV